MFNLAGWCDKPRIVIAGQQVDKRRHFYGIEVELLHSPLGISPIVNYGNIVKGVAKSIVALCGHIDRSFEGRKGGFGTTIKVGVHVWLLIDLHTLRRQSFTQWSRDKFAALVD